MDMLSAIAVLVRKRAQMRAWATVWPMAANWSQRPINGNYANSIAMRELSARNLGHFTHHIQIG
jgi:hypothetical protein